MTTWGWLRETVNMANFIKDQNALTCSRKAEASPCFPEYPAFQNMFS